MRVKYNYGRKREPRPIAAYKNTVLIYNPRAGKFGRNSDSLVARIVRGLQQGGHNVTSAPTTGPGTAGRIAREHIGSGADLIVVAGGDGTINETLEGMVHSPVPLAILPAGTANVLAMEMKIGARVERALEQFSQWQPRRISVGQITCDAGRVTRHFLCMAGIGLDARIVYHLSAGLKARAGKLAYWVASWSVMRQLPEMEVDVAGGNRRCSFALLSKVRNYGGDFEIAREVTLFDDMFEVVLFEGRSAVPYMKYFVGMALNRLSGMQGVTVLRAEHAKLYCPGDHHIYVQVDGEFAGHLPAEVRIVRDALTLLVPREYGGG